MTEKEDLYVLPEPSTATCFGGIRIDWPGKYLCMYFDYFRDDIAFNSGLRFKNVRAHSFTAELHCPGWKVKAAYDTLVRIPNSKWVQELLETTSADRRNLWTMNHYIIYFDGPGCIEIIAESWEVLPERPGTLSEYR